MLDFAFTLDDISVTVTLIMHQIRFPLALGHKYDHLTQKPFLSRQGNIVVALLNSVGSLCQSPLLRTLLHQMVTTALQSASLRLCVVWAYRTSVVYSCDHGGPPLCGQRCISMCHNAWSYGQFFLPSGHQSPVDTPAAVQRHQMSPYSCVDDPQLHGFRRPLKVDELNHPCACDGIDEAGMARHS